MRHDPGRDAAHRHQHDPEHPAHHGAGGHETRDASVRVAATYALGLVVALVVVHLGLLALYRGLVRERGPEPSIAAPADLYDQYRALRKAEDATLEGYGWVDREAGIVRIPIDRALKLAAERGVPAGKGPRTEVELNSHHGIPARVDETPAGKAGPESKSGAAAQPKTETKTKDVKP